MNDFNYIKAIANKFNNTTNKLAKYGDYLVKFASEKLKASPCEGFIVGISGGVDSALVLTTLLKVKNAKVHGVFINIDNSELDKKCVELLKKQYKFSFSMIDLSKQFKELVKTFKIKNPLAIANLKSRLRTIYLYAISQEKNLLVCGTSNADELLVGYFTKFGDNACDISLLCRLTKSQIYHLAKLAKVPQEIIIRQPSAGLFEKQTDEKDLNLKYTDMDKYLVGDVIDETTENRIIMLNRKNRHKLNAPHKPKKFLNLRTVKY